MMKMTCKYKIAAITATAMLSSGLSHAALTTGSFTDAGFEDQIGAAVDGRGNAYHTMNPDSYNATAALTTGKVFTDSAIVAGKWNVHGVNALRQAALVANNNYRGGSTVPANASGSYWITASRDYNQNRGFMQFVSDAAATTGSITMSIDYWVREANQSTAAGTSTPARISFEIFAFNDLADVTFTSANQSAADLDVIQYIGTGGFASVGGSFDNYDTVSATTGFQTLSRTIDLGAGYNYVGVAISNYGADAQRAGAGAVASFDNLQVVPVPEPSAALLGGLGTLLLLRRRRN